LLQLPQRLLLLLISRSAGIKSSVRTAPTRRHQDVTYHATTVRTGSTITVLDSTGFRHPGTYPKKPSTYPKKPGGFFWVHAPKTPPQKTYTSTLT